MVIREIQIQIEEEEVLHLLDCQKGTEIYEEFQEEFRAIKDDMEALCEPLLIIEPGEIPEELAREDLKAKTRVLMVLYTIGDGISRYSTQAFQKGDYVKGMLANSMADAALFSLGRQLPTYLKSAGAECKMGISRRLEAPHDIDMKAQKIVFEKTRANEICGMKISSGYMLDPVKSSAVMYVLSEDPDLFFHQHNCRKCNRLDCKGRHIPDIPVKVWDGADQYVLSVAEQESLLDALVSKKNSAFGAICGGTGRCGKCKIRVKSGFLPVTAADEKCLTEEERKQGIRLACRAYPQEPLEVALCFREEMKVLSSYQKPAAESDQENQDEESVTYAIAADIGTTTIVMQLLTSDGARTVGTDASMNHQRSYGADVISRIKASTEGKAEILTQMIRRDLTEGISRLLKKYSVDSSLLRKVVIAGNTTMLHLLKGYDCSGLGRYPFQPVTVASESGRLSELLGETAIDIHDDCEYYLLPGISAFVGADIVAGLCFAGADLEKEVSLFVDLGTNGEIALGSCERILVTSTAAGPAFEGGNLTWGTGSVEGAICGMTLQDGTPVIRTIGEKPAVGICGTGVIEAIAALYQAGIIDETGLLAEEYFEDGYPLAQTAEGSTIVLTQKDIREIQLAKAAVRAGIKILLLRYQICAEEVKTVYLAGGFGFGLDVEKAVQIGMLPETLLSKVKVIGNSSLGGAVSCLTSDTFRERTKRVGAIAEEINLSADANFNEFYMKYMFMEDEEA